MAFIALPGKGGRSGLMPSRVEGAMGSFIVFSSWTILGLVDIKVKFQASSTLWFQPV